MPISSTTISELKKTTAQFDFLLTVSNIKLKTIPPDQRFCVICQEPFDNNVWKFGDTVNRPVKLECGHVFGIQCLTHLVFTSDFSNRCPLCRAQVMPISFEKNPSGQSWKAAVPLLRLVMMFGGNRANFAKKKALDVLQNGLEREGLTGPVPGKHMHRIMVLYEEFLNQFCDHPQPTGDAERLAVAEDRIQELDGIMRGREEVERGLEESRVSLARRQELARSEAENELENELEDVKEELRVVKEAMKDARDDLQWVKGELREAEKQRIGSEKEVESLKKELEEVKAKARKGLEEAEEKARRELEGAEKESKDAMETALKEFGETVKSLKAKASLAWLFFRLSLLGVVVTLVWVYL